MLVTYYVYITKTGKLIYKKTKWDNYLCVNEKNQYGHKLLIKE